MRFRRSQKAAEDLSPYMPGHVIDYPKVESGGWRAGIVFASPHSGSIYPDSLLKNSKLTVNQLRRNEDIYIDQLFQATSSLGAPLLKARFPRVVVDVNRSEDELPTHWADIDPDKTLHQPTARAAAGLGVVPTFLSESLPIYHSLPNKADVKARLEHLYVPYHDALKTLVSDSLSRFGQALLIDCHSMPGFAPMGSRRPDIILGDRFGTSCHPDTVGHFRQLFQSHGYSVGINYPYAGGFVTSHYGDTANGVEAIQIEINRDLYVNPVTLTQKKDGFEKLTANLESIIGQIIERAIPQDLAAQ